MERTDKSEILEYLDINDFPISTPSHIEDFEYCDFNDASLDSRSTTVTLN